MITQAVIDAALNNIMSQHNFSDCMKLAREASKGGKLYIAGGKLYRSIIEVLYGYDAGANRCDFDFVTTSMQHPDLKNGWRLNENKGKKPYLDANGNPRSTHFIKDGYGELDIVFIPTILQVKEGELPNSIEGYLKSVPLDLQAIAIDCDSGDLLGAPGQRAIKNRMVSINNQKSITAYCDFKGMSEENYIRRKAESVLFNYMWRGGVRETTAPRKWELGIDVAPVITNLFNNLQIQ
jgi:hypothetical protein